MGMQQTKQDQPQGSAIVDISSGDSRAPLLRTLQQDNSAGTEEHGKDAAHFPIPEGHGNQPGCEVDAFCTAICCGTHVSRKGEPEGNNVEKQNAQQ